MAKKKPITPNPTEPLYQITMTAEQVSAVSEACELFTRIRLGQFSDIIWKVYPDRLGQLDRDLTDKLFDGLGMVLRGKLSHYGSDSDWSKEAEVTWDIHQVLRNRLAWDKNPEGNSMNVHFDDPMPKCYGVKLAQIVKVE